MVIESLPESSLLPLKVLAFDFGTQKIGVAFGQTLTDTAQAIGLVKANDGIPNWTEVEELIAQWQPSVFLIGLPFNMDGSESDLLMRARKFGKRLHGRYGKQCFGVDERLTSVEAREEAELEGRPKDQAIDDIAAQIMLQSWLREIRMMDSSRQT